MSSADFDPSSLDRSVPQSAKDGIVLLLQSWATFEVALTDWLVEVSNMPADIGILIVGRQDTRAKIDKLKEIFIHVGEKEQVAALTALAKNNEGYSKIRNAVVHNIYMGHRRAPEHPDQCELIYSPHRPTRGRRDAMNGVIIRLDDLRKTAQFAIDAASRINDALRRRRHE